MQNFRATTILALNMQYFLGFTKKIRLIIIIIIIIIIMVTKKG